MLFGKKMIDVYHDILAEHVCPGDTVIDATAGNGHDTQFLCRLVGRDGCVHAFDIQSKAIENTKNLLESEGLLKQACLHLDSHEHVDTYVNEQISAFCFNLGYLPDKNENGEQKIITHSSTTLDALEKCLNLLKPQGIGCILVYRGHEGGEEESKNVEIFLKNLPPKKYEVLCIFNHNRANQPPILYLARKIK